MNKDDLFFDCLCCAGEGHTIRQGGSHINMVQLTKLAKWPYLVAMNCLVPDSPNYPLACALVCDKCLKAGNAILYATAGEPSANGPVYYRVPLDDLEEPEFYWPDHHPDYSESLSFD